MRLDDVKIDALQEMVNIGVGRAAAILNAMLHAHVGLSVPKVEILLPEELAPRVRDLGKGTLSIVRLGFKGSFSGMASLVFSSDSAARLVAHITEEEDLGYDLDAIRIGTLTEVGNIVLNGVMGAVGNEIARQIFYTVPTYTEDLEWMLTTADGELFRGTVVWAQTRLSVHGSEIIGDVILLFEVGSLDALQEAIDRSLERS